MHPATVTAFLNELEKISGLSDMGGFTGRAGVLTGDVAKPANTLRSASNIRGKPAMGSGGFLHTQPKPAMPKAVSSIMPKAPSTVAPKVAPKAGGLMGSIKTLFK